MSRRYPVAVSAALAVHVFLLCRMRGGFLPATMMMMPKEQEEEEAAAPKESDLILPVGNGSAADASSTFFFISSGRKRIPFTFSDPKGYSGPVVPGWPPGGPTRHIVKYIKPEDKEGLLLVRPDVSPTCRLLIFVHSSPGSSGRRSVIRRTWADPRFLRAGGPEVQDRQGHPEPCVVFAMGRSRASEVTPEGAERLYQEQKKFRDVLQADFVDTYTNLSLKSIFALKFLHSLLHSAARGGSQIAYVFKVDDDSFVNVHGLVAGIGAAQELTSSKRDMFVMGHVFGADNKTITPFRAPEETSPPSPARYAPKWTVPSYMFDGAEYPQMVSGAGYLATAPAAECIYRSVFAYPYFHLEDVLLTGFAAQDCNLTFVMHWGFKAWNSRVDDFGATDVLFHFSTERETEFLHKAINFERMEDRFRQLLVRLEGASSSFATTKKGGETSLQ